MQIYLFVDREIVIHTCTDKFTTDFEGIVVVRQAATCHLLNLYNTIVFLF